MMHDDMVSVVIPTVGRPSVISAVESALAQTVKPTEVMVVVDGPGLSEIDETLSRSIQRAGARLLLLPQPSGDAGASARNLGVEQAMGQFVAFLDDDDEWHPRKLERQLALTPSGAEAVVVGSRVEWKTQSLTITRPPRVPRPGEHIPNYLFSARHGQRGLLATSGILTNRQFALRVPFREGLRQHVDYQFCIDAWHAGALFLMPLQALVKMDGSIRRQSVTRTSRYQASLEWALANEALLGPEAFAGFLLGDTARMTRRDHDIRGFSRLLRTAVTSGGATTPVVAKSIAGWIVGERGRLLFRRIWS